MELDHDLGPIGSKKLKQIKRLTSSPCYALHTKISINHVQMPRKYRGREKDISAKSWTLLPPYLPSDTESKREPWTWIQTSIGSKLISCTIVVVAFFDDQQMTFNRPRTSLKNFHFIYFELKRENKFIEIRCCNIKVILHLSSSNIIIHLSSSKNFHHLIV